MFVLALVIISAVADDSLGGRFAPPPGYTRVPVASGSLGEYLRKLPLLAGKPEVLLYDGQPKRNQNAHVAVVDLDVGERDLQQCADAVIRIIAEYKKLRGDDVCFTLTSGAPMPWSRWRAGERPHITNRETTWTMSAKSDDSARNWRAYLDTLFTYAGTRSLAHDTTLLPDDASIESGDIFVEPGSPGHAVLVVDVAVADSDPAQRVFMLVQSYMPAQQIHVLKGPWFTPATPLVTPEWIFPTGSHRRMTKPPCR